MESSGSPPTPLATPARLVPLAEIERVLPRLELVAAMERAFVAASTGEMVLGSIGELVFAEPPGDVHVKSGYRRGGDAYVVKIASGFYRNPARGLPSSDGLVALFDQSTGELRVLLHDRGRLTDERTAAAGAVAAKHLARPDTARIGILGSGTQARRQLAWLREVTPCREVLVWGRDPEHAQTFADFARGLGFSAQARSEAGAVARDAGLLVTTTPATAPLFAADDIRPGTHITAVGADTSAKRELPGGLLARATRVVADSRAQCRERGEIAWALRDGEIGDDDVIELGEIVAGAPGRTSPTDITIADLTGLAAQDLEIARAVLAALGQGESGA